MKIFTDSELIEIDTKAYAVFILTPEEKELIKDMPDECNVFTIYDDNQISPDEIKEIMNKLKNEEKQRNE